jgi:hypothetical protein
MQEVRLLSSKELRSLRNTVAQCTKDQKKMTGFMFGTSIKEAQTDIQTCCKSEQQKDGDKLQGYVHKMAQSTEQQKDELVHTFAVSRVTSGLQKPPNLRKKLVPATFVFFTRMNLYVGLNSSVQMLAFGGTFPATHCILEGVFQGIHLNLQAGAKAAKYLDGCVFCAIDRRHV